MKCVIPGINIKVFGRAVHSLAKVGDELYVEPGPSGVSFRTVNTSRSAFASFHFGTGFFSHYDEGSTGEQSDATEEAVKCKVAMKAFLNMFKSLATLERNVEKCKLILDGEEAKLGIQLTCRFGIIKTYNLSFIECETLQAVYDKSTCTNYIQSQARVLGDALVNFQSNQEEVTLCVSQEKTIIRNYVDDEPDPAKAIHTVLTMEAGEFDGYDISTECEVTFCLKELRSVLAFAEPVNLPVTSYFSSPGSPIIFICDNNPMFEATFVLATLAKKSDSQVPRSQSMGGQVSQTTQNQAISGVSSCLQNAPENPRNHTMRSGSRLAGSPLHSRRSEQISPTHSTLHENEGNTSLPSSSMLHPKDTHRLSKDSASPSALHLTSKVNGNISHTRHEESLADLETSEMVAHEETCTIPGTPPAKKTNFFFRRCFESTFDPNSVPGNDKVLAEDSDEDT